MEWTALSRCARGALLFAAAALPSCSREVLQVHRHYGPFRERAERQERHALDLRQGDALTIDVRVGSVDVKVVRGKEPSLTINLTAHGRSSEEALRILDSFHVRVSRRGSGVRVSLEGEPLEIEMPPTFYAVSPSGSFQAEVPPGVSLRVHTSQGTIGALGPLGPCDLSTGYGKVTLDGATGDVRLLSGSGAVEATRTQAGKLDVETDGSVTLRDIRASQVLVETSSGFIAAHRLSATKSILKTGFGQIQVDEGSGSLAAVTSSGNIDVQDFEGSVEARSGFGAVDVAGVLRGLNASTTSGSVTADARLGSRVRSAWKLESGFGPVNIAVPAEASFRILAETLSGSIASEFPIRPEAGSDGSSRLKGAAGKGGEEIVLRTGSGDIHVRASKEPTRP
ncbi:MAG TPA: DUF4097 family beta strand repeat-containing protein [Planctomycetota bacterium]|nr:DUF4097 family beta strand repeat-containing protein [Planctomycetota bacterium]